jgi:hypothetical protein
MSVWCALHYYYYYCGTTDTDVLTTTSPKKTTGYRNNKHLYTTMVWDETNLVAVSQKTWSRCYDHNFLRFFPIFGEKNGVFLKNHCYDQNFCII